MVVTQCTQILAFKKAIFYHYNLVYVPLHHVGYVELITKQYSVFCVIFIKNYLLHKHIYAVVPTTITMVYFNNEM